MAYSGILAVTAFAALVFVALADEACPSKQDFAPCTCDGEGVNCMGPLTLDQIRRAFKAQFKYGGVRSMWIQATKITTVPADIFNNIKVQEAYIEVNNLTSLDLRAFDGSSRSLSVFSLYGNGLRDFDFAGLKKFEVLSTLNLGNNKISSVTGVESQYLRTLILAQNEISHIGPDAFTNAPNLYKLELSQNKLKTLGPRSISLKSDKPLIGLVSNEIATVDARAFEGSSPQLIRLSANRLTHLKEDAFRNLATRIAPHGGVIEIYSNPLTCRGCDFLWLVQNKDVFERVFTGFYCQTGGNLKNLDRDKIGCSS